MADDVVRGKVTRIEHCLGRIRELYGDEPERLDDPTTEEAILLNLLRACETSIDRAMHLVSSERLGLPEASREAFELLRRAGIVDDSLCERLQRMVGFRNVAVHEYQRIDRGILVSILRERLGDFEELCRAAMTR